MFCVGLPTADNLCIPAGRCADERKSKPDKLHIVRTVVRLGGINMTPLPLIFCSVITISH